MNSTPIALERTKQVRRCPTSFGYRSARAYAESFGDEGLPQGLIAVLERVLSGV